MVSRISRLEADISTAAMRAVWSAERAGASVINSRRASLSIASRLPGAGTFSHRETDEIHIIARQAMWDAALTSTVTVNWES